MWPRSDGTSSSGVVARGLGYVDAGCLVAQEKLLG